jgi:hypothetical protein
MQKKQKKIMVKSTLKARQKTLVKIRIMESLGNSLKDVERKKKEV